MKSQAALLGCGILSPLLYLASDALASLRYEGYSYPHQTLSELNAIGAPTRPLTALFGLALYLLLIGFGIGVWRSAAGQRRLRVVGALVISLGAVSVALGPFASMQPRGVEQGTSGMLHLVGIAVGAATILPSILVSATAFGPRFRIYAIVTLVVMVAFGAWAGAEAPRIEEGLPTPWVGVKERISVYSYQLWFAVLAVTLLRRERARDG